ncbi:MAG: proton-translocating transhydrogenase family protein, partial [Bacteroidota bacterium]
SGSNAISGITIVGAVVVVGAIDSPVAKWIGLAALILATINVVGGFLVTDRMLEMFKPRDREAS